MTTNTNHQRNNAVTDMFSNIITTAVERVDAKLTELDPEAIERLGATATLTTGEWAALGEMPSRMMRDGVLPPDAAQTLHMIHTSYNSTATLAQRIIFLQVVREYMAATRAAR